MARVAFDVHGVLDTYEYFRELLQYHYHNGDTVFIISGQRLDRPMKKFLDEYDLRHHYYFSIVTELEKDGENIEWKDGLPFVDAEKWDPVKATICENENIDIMYDDSPVYKDTFNDIKTVYVHIVNPNRKQYKTR